MNHRPIFLAPAQSSRKTLNLAMMAGALTCMMGGNAYADDTAPTSATQDGGSLWSQLWGTKADIVAGFGAGIDQRYMGARAFRPLLVPMLSINRGIFFADTVKGLGVQYQSAGGFYIGDAFNYDQGRNNRNDWLRPGSNDLRQYPSVKGTITNTVTLAQQFAPWFSINAQAELGLDGHRRGNQYQFGIESIAYKAGRETLTLDLDAKIGDAQYNRTYFGTGTTGNNRYAPGFGVYGYTVSATWDHRFDKHWAAELILSGVLYTAKVADSPIVQRRVGITALPSVSYTF